MKTAKKKLKKKRIKFVTMKQVNEIDILHPEKSCMKEIATQNSYKIHRK